jgi:hypothetical protein
MINEPRFLAGLDLGKRQDYTALAILERRRRVSGWDPVYFCQKVEWDMCVRRLVRFPLGTSYRDLVNLIEHELRSPQLGFETPLVLDATGVGEVMYDLLRGSIQHLVPVTITSTGSATLHNGRHHVPKEQLAQVLSVLLEGEKLHCVRRLPLAQTLYDEFRNFEVKVRPNGRESFGAFKDGTHDDLVMSVALACWYARKLWPDSFTPRSPPRPTHILCV